VQSNIEPRF